MRKEHNTPAARTAGVFLYVLALLGSPTVLTSCGSSDSGAGVVQQSDEQGVMKTAQLKITGSSGDHLLSVELALNPAQQRQGLMYRRDMPDDHGMLFIYGTEKEIGMWMKNTLMPLDMLFFNQDGKITRIARNTEPFSERIIRSGSPVYGVLEVKAGTSDRLRINVGDRVHLPAVSP
jgi:uncharacterized membrane protein (UPF0127 family)